MKRFLIILMTAVMLMGGTVSAFAMEYPSNLPTLPDKEEAAYIVYNNNGSYEMLAVEGSNFSGYNVRMETGSLYVTADANYNLVWYTIKENEWYQEMSVNFAANKEAMHGIGSADSFLVYSNIDVYDSEGDLVFPLPLAEEIRGVAEETLTVEVPKLNQTVLTVVLCGVGCLALLISLPLLRKVLSHFLH